MTSAQMLSLSLRSECEVVSAAIDKTNRLQNTKTYTDFQGNTNIGKLIVERNFNLRAWLLTTVLKDLK